MAFLGNNSGNHRPKPPSAPSGRQLCPHCGKDINEAPRKAVEAPASGEMVLVQHYIDELEKAGGLSTWETEFLNSVTDQFKKRGSLSLKQISTLQKSYEEKA
jgi:hypothetical protein